MTPSRPPGLPDDAARLLGTPPPPLDIAGAAAALGLDYGIAGAVLRPLAGERDRNYMTTLADGSRRVFKVYHEAEDAATRTFQNGLLLHLERAGVACAVPRLIRTREGAEDCGVKAGGRSYRAVLISVVPGDPGHLEAAGPALRQDLGRTAASLDAVMASYDHPAARRVLLWDHMQLERLAWVVEDVPDARTRRWLGGFVERFRAEIRPRAIGLPAQVIHNDMNGANVFVAGAAVTGIIDFGDAVFAPRINEIAVAANYCLGSDRDPVAAIGDVMAGYDAVLTLDEAEVDLLHDLVLARLALRLLMYRWRAALFPENRHYILRNGAAAGRLLDHLAGSAPGAGRDALLARWTVRRRER